MVEITWVRHGQATTGATDEDSYDNLSPLGHQQAEWLGSHFAETGRAFDLILSGSFRRQDATAKA
ncbi:MAG: histidine phosphatase family protein, partial [Deltaproteobacteria bacterium]